MSTLRIAHFSDTHVLSLTGVRARRFFNKRWTGAVNLALNRAKHYRVEVFEALLGALVATAPDHTVCTGDLVNLALEPEFERVAEMLRAHFAPEDLTVVPGNHDAYAKDAIAEDLFERYFGQFQGDELGIGAGRYPVTRLRDGLLVIGLDTAIPTRVFMANGRVGTPQVAALRAALAHPEAQARFRLLMLHHPLLPDPSRRLEASRRLDDAADLNAALAACGDRAPHLVVHGHNHAFKRQRVPGTDIPVVQVASASRSGAHNFAEFNVYVVRDGQLVDIERHVHDPETGAFVARDVDGVALAS